MHLRAKVFGGVALGLLTSASVSFVGGVAGASVAPGNHAWSLRQGTEGHEMRAVMPDTSLESLGKPTITQVSGCGGHSYKSVSRGAKLRMAGQIYRHGFRLVTDEFCGGAGPSSDDRWAWHIGTAYKTFTSAVGLDSNNSTGVKLEFLGTGNRPVKFIADGRSVESVNLVTGVPTDIKMRLTSVRNLIAETQVNQSARTGGPESQAAIDFADDNLTTGSGSFPPRPSHISSLQALGAATSQELSGCDGRSYKSVSDGAKLRMAGNTYHRGFQIRTDQFCGGAGPIAQETWSWHVAGLFTKLTALVGLDSTNSTGATLRFLGPDNKPLKFTADGASVSVTNLVSGVPTKIVLDLNGALNVKVETTVTIPGPESRATMDFANDILTRG
jgi:hypothetical protein